MFIIIREAPFVEKLKVQRRCYSSCNVPIYVETESAINKNNDNNRNAIE